MFKIQSMFVCVYFAVTLIITMWSVSCLVKALDCDQGGEIQSHFKHIITTINMTENNCDDVTIQNNHNKNYTYVGHNYSNPLQV